MPVIDQKGILERNFAAKIEAIKLPLQVAAKSENSTFLENSNNLNSLSGKLDPKYQEEKINTAAQDFEALLLHQMIGEMWKASGTDKDALFGEDQQSMSFYRDMFNEAIAKSISSGRGIGIKEVVVDDMKKLENRRALTQNQDQAKRQDLDLQLSELNKIKS